MKINFSFLQGKYLDELYDEQKLFMAMTRDFVFNRGGIKHNISYYSKRQDLEAKKDIELLTPMQLKVLKQDIKNFEKEVKHFAKIQRMIKLQELDKEYGFDKVKNG